MDAFDNPARNGMTGPQRDGASVDQSNQAVSGSEFLAAAANVTAAASTIALAIQAILVPDASGRIVLPAGASIDDITISGTDLVNAGEQIMQVVPLGDKLLIETRVTPRDIAFIKVGDPANVKVTAYDFSIYGGLKGRVVRVSADSIYDEVERQAYFTVVVETTNSYLTSNGRRLPITPGMLCDVEIVTGKKSVLSYLLKPVLKVSGSALTER